MARCSRGPTRGCVSAGHAVKNGISLLVFFQATLESQERWEDLVRVTLNGATGVRRSRCPTCCAQMTPEMAGGDRMPVDVAWAKSGGRRTWPRPRPRNSYANSNCGWESATGSAEEYYGALLGRGRPGKARRRRRRTQTAGETPCRGAGTAAEAAGNRRTVCHSHRARPDCAGDRLEMPASLSNAR